MSGSPAQLRVRHERLVFESLQRAGVLSRAELAKQTGLSAPTVGKVVAGLLSRGLVEEATDAGNARNEHGAGTSLAGRPGRPLRLSRGGAAVVAVQLGVRHTRLAALPVGGPAEDAQVDWPVQFATPRSAEAWAARLKQSAAKLRLGRRTENVPVVVSLPGVVDEAAGRVLLSPNLHWLEKADVAALVRGALRRKIGPVPVFDEMTKSGPVPVSPVLAMQEIRALALGHLVNRLEERDFLLVDVGEGVGGAAVVGGRLYEGALALSGELGHTPVLGNFRGCGCGAIGCVETLVSRGGLLASFAASQRRESVPRWAELQRHVAEGGIEPWLEEALGALAVTIGGALNVLGLRKVVVTGALVELGEAVVARLAEGVRGAAMWGRFGEVVCEAAPRRRAAGLVARVVDRVLLGRDQGTEG